MNAGYDSASCKLLDQDHVADVYDLVKNVEIPATDCTRAFMAATFPGEEWAVRDPHVLPETTATDDNCWKGGYADIFTTAMENNFKAGSVLVDSILDGTLRLSLHR